MASIIKVSDRQKLKPRRDPYWHRLDAGCYLGVRVQTTSSPGSWLARWRDPDTERQRYTTLGTFEELPESGRFDAASKAARAWFTHVGHGGSTETFTVNDACARYVAHLKRTKGEESATDAEGRFTRHVLSDARFAALPLHNLRPAHIDAWRQALQDRATPSSGKRSPASLNRDMTALRAALNLAHTDGLVATDIAWRAKLAPLKGADGRRDVYLDRDQRRKLIEASPPDLAQFIRGMCLSPLRPGALAELNAGHYDKRLKTLSVGKDKAGGDRRMQLPPTTAEFFGNAAKGKLPAAPLLARADGQRWDKDAWKHPFKEAARSADLPPQACMYVLRHSVITDLVIAGLPLLTVAQLSGTSARMIELHYGHLRAETATAALEALAL